MNARSNEPMNRMSGDDARFSFGHLGMPLGGYLDRWAASGENVTTDYPDFTDGNFIIRVSI